jgi:hypothetical protein
LNISSDTAADPTALTTSAVHFAGRGAETFEANRLRDRATLRAGYRTIRLTKMALADEAAVARDLAAQLASRG